MRVQNLLAEKNRPVHTLAGDRSVDEAVHLMASEKISALIVTENDQPVGIFAERDVFRSYLKDPTATLTDLTLYNAMTGRLVTAGPEDEVGTVIAVMVKADIRHLPVIEEKKIIGMLTLNDLIEGQIKALNSEIHQLTDYIEDLHDAGRD